MDVLFVSPGNATTTYQDLAQNLSAIEPPTWSLLLAQSCRAAGHEVGILDINAEQLTPEAATQRIKRLNPRLLCFVVYGQNVNAGTTSMSGATDLSTYLKTNGVLTPVCYIGSHIQALPKKTLEEEPSIDFGLTNEGVYALRNILSLDSIDISDFADIKGVVWRGPQGVVINTAEAIVPQDRMDIDLPGYAWDLLPYDKKPLDLYRAPLWHADYDEEARSPYAAIQTSLGCQFKCNFCMINIINRNDEAEIGIASDYSGMRYWSTDFIIKEFDKLVELGVHTIKITDELFLLNKRYYEPLCTKLRDRGYGKFLKLWAYSRIDTIRRPEILKLVKEAGINWLALGIESADKNVRLEVSKGKFEDVDIAKVIGQVHDAGIGVMANYIFGLPGDTMESMKSTLELSKELCTLGWNAYPAMALPGSPLYKQGLDSGLELPVTYEGYSFHSYDIVPLRNKALTAAEIVKFRDEAFIEYHSYPPFLEIVREKSGQEGVDNIKKMLEVKLKRKILES